MPAHACPIVCRGTLSVFGFWVVVLGGSVCTQHTRITVEASPIALSLKRSSKNKSFVVSNVFQKVKILVNFWCTSGHRGGRKTSLP
jgi:P pilus assembly chaperone PapD